MAEQLGELIASIIVSCAQIWALFTLYQIKEAVVKKETNDT